MDNSRFRRWRRTGPATIALALAATVLSGVAPARADVGAQVAAPFRVAASTGFSSVNKSVAVACPVGRQVYGTGAEITGANGAVMIDDLVPNVTLTSVFATAVEVGAFAGNWQLTVYAVCGLPTLNLQRVFFTSATNSVNSKSVFAGCPTGLRLYGLGASINGGTGIVVLDDLIPNVGLTGATVTGTERVAFAGVWNVTGYAICGNPAATMTRVAVNTATNSLSPKTTIATCPAGTRVHGTGAEITGALGAVVVDDLTPVLNLTSVIVTGAENTAFAGNWFITAYAICSS
ncbi:hypothetical protein [Micromonospora zhanjiangensis]|uniref:Secreted protein n=1 Tax=Micromonospora zhanjiangensis TaxID=1522057 RepID=A0ABV8KN38_9ACTN